MNFFIATRIAIKKNHTIFPVLLARTVFFGRIPKYGFGHETDRQKMLRTQKHRQIRRLGEPNPMDDVPDPDSGKIPEKSLNLFGLPEQDRDICVPRLPT